MYRQRIDGGKYAHSASRPREKSCQAAHNVLFAWSCVPAIPFANKTALPDPPSKCIMVSQKQYFSRLHLARVKDKNK